MMMSQMFLTACGRRPNDRRSRLPHNVLTVLQVNVGADPITGIPDSLITQSDLLGADPITGIPDSLTT